MKASKQIETEPGVVEIKKEDIGSDTLNDQFECSSNLVSNIPSSSYKFSSNDILLLKIKPEFLEFVDDKDINLKAEEHSSADELSDDEFIETCIKVEKQTKHDYKKCDNIDDDAFLNRKYREAYINQYNEVKVEKDGEFEDDNVEANGDADVEGDVDIKGNINFEGDMKVEDGNIKFEKEIKMEEDIDVVDHEIRFEINASSSYKNNRAITEHGSSKIRYNCTHCSYETPTLHTLKRHLQLHEDPSKVVLYFCTKCPYKSRQKGHLKRHDLVHQYIPNDDGLCFRCRICEFMTKRKCTLKRHVRSVHLNRKYKGQEDFKNENEVFRCDKCSYGTYTKGLLTAHMDKHKDTNDVNSLYICNICSFSTKYRRNLRVHFETHKESSELKNNQCKICNFKTRLPYCLKRHLRSRKHLLAVGKIEQYSPRTPKS